MFLQGILLFVFSQFSAVSRWFVWSLYVCMMWQGFTSSFALFSILGRLWRGCAVFSESNWNFKAWTKVCNLSEVCLALFWKCRESWPIDAMNNLSSLILLGNSIVVLRCTCKTHNGSEIFTTGNVFFSYDRLRRFSLLHKIHSGTWRFDLQRTLLKYNMIFYA